MIRRKVRFTKTAREHVRQFRIWWQEHSVRPEILQHDLGQAVEMLAVLPASGSPYPAAPMLGVRRLYLERLMSHLYYTHDSREVIIWALWHARRGSGPDFGK